jgi:hypothetical protein
MLERLANLSYWGRLRAHRRRSAPDVHAVACGARLDDPDDCRRE